MKSLLPKSWLVVLSCFFLNAWGVSCSKQSKLEANCMCWCYVNFCIFAVCMTHEREVTVDQIYHSHASTAFNDLIIRSEWFFCSINQTILRLVFRSLNLIGQHFHVDSYMHVLERSLQDDPLLKSFVSDCTGLVQFYESNLNKIAYDCIYYAPIIHHMNPTYRIKPTNIET